MSGPDSSVAARDSFLEIGQIGGRARTYYHLVGNHHLIGRRPDASIVLDHWSVSRNHASLELGPSGGWWIHDLGSTNGTYVNGTRAEERLLSPGDELQIGEYSLRMRSSSVPDFPSPISSTRGGALRHTPAAAATKAPTTSEGEPPPATRRSTPQIGAEHLATVMSLGRNLMRVENLSRRQSTLCEFIVGDVFPAMTAAIIRVDQERTATVIGTPLSRGGPAPPLELSPDCLGRLWDTREPVLAGAAQPDLTSETGQRTRRSVSVVLVPLAATDKSIDALYAEFPPLYGSAEWVNLVALAAEAYQQAELVWDMREQVRQSAFIEGELEMARQIQEGLVPRSFALDGLELAVGFEPCRWVGGDYVDAFQLPDGRVLFAIADVCGKGLQAALVASSLHTLVRVAGDTATRLPDLLNRVNEYLLDYLPEHSFVTMLCAVLDCVHGELEIITAGHPPCFIVRPDGSYQSYPSTRNLGLGIIRTEFESQRVSLGVGDVLLMYTDGLTEMENHRREPFGAERLGAEFAGIVSLNPGARVDSMRHRLIDVCQAYRGSALAADDSTFLLVARRAVTMRPPSLPSLR